MKHFYCLFFLFVFGGKSGAQINEDSLKNKLLTDSSVREFIPVQQDSATGKDTTGITASTDSVSLRPDTGSLPAHFSTGSFWQQFRKYIYESNRLIGFSARVETRQADRKVYNGKEDLFYYFIFLLVLFGLLRLAFPKYFYDLFRVFFRTTLKQKQVREQLLQSALPSILMNGFFVLTAGLYINFQLQYFSWQVTDNFWMQYLYCMIALSSIYLVKFIGLKISGWLFNVSGATDSYIFIVFIINKMIGLFLLPLLVFIAFTGEPVYGIAITLSWFGLVLLYGYRFILSYGVVRNEVKLNPFHFILYLLAFEIIPLLLIYKLLLIVF